MYIFVEKNIKKYKNLGSTRPPSKGFVLEPSCMEVTKMKIMISGGCKNEKSSHAQRLAKKMQYNNKSLYYIATMIPTDIEDDERILRHKKEREGLEFKTIEANRDITNCVKNYDMSDVFLLDSVTALLANEMFKENEQVNLNAHVEITKDLIKIVKKMENIVIVTDYIHSDAFKYDLLTEEFRKGLAYIGMALAKICDVVLEACYANFIVHKGHKLLGELNETI